MLAIVAGTTVDFPNSDRTYHNVFSLSKTRSFDLGRYAAGRSKAVRFDQPGIVRVFCDIHSHMSAFILVFSHRYFAVTDDEGRYRIDNVPPGSYTVVAWHESLPSETRRVAVPEGGETDLQFHALEEMSVSLVPHQSAVSGDGAARRGVDRRGDLLRDGRGDGAGRRGAAARARGSRAPWSRSIAACSSTTSAREAALVADLPRFKATVELNDPPTMRPVAEDYRKQLGADLLVVTNPRGTVLAEIAASGKEAIVDVVSVPILVIDPYQPEILGTLTVGFALDARARRHGSGR